MEILTGTPFSCGQLNEHTLPGIPRMTLELAETFALFRRFGKADGRR